jgi:hypothetical protein
MMKSERIATAEIVFLPYRVNRIPVDDFSTLNNFPFSKVR